MNNRRKLLSALTALTLASAAPSAGQAADAPTPGEPEAIQAGPQVAHLSRILAQAAPELLEHLRWCLKDQLTDERLGGDLPLENLLRLDARTLSCLDQLQTGSPLQIQQAEIY